MLKAELPDSPTPKPDLRSSQFKVPCGTPTVSGAIWSRRRNWEEIPQLTAEFASHLIPDKLSFLHRSHFTFFLILFSLSLSLVAKVLLSHPPPQLFRFPPPPSPPPPPASLPWLGPTYAPNFKPEPRRGSRTRRPGLCKQEQLSFPLEAPWESGLSFNLPGAAGREEEMPPARGRMCGGGCRRKQQRPSGASGMEQRVEHQVAGRGGGGA